MSSRVRFMLGIVFSGLTLGLLPGCSDNSAAEPPREKVRWASLRVQLASGEPQTGFVPMTDEAGRTVHVGGDVIFDERDLVAARALHARDGSVVELEFTRPAAARLAEVSEANLGALLAFVVEGRLVNAPKIVSRIDGGIAYLSANLDRDAAEKLARRIHPPEPAQAAGGTSDRPRAAP
ncbi:MAG: hypothetical protein HRU75_10790 [Planctomycetia bacterium]|nr:MAG: hypothetical protein HRU75_10790 [Planctomycetia bacterium]